METKVIYDFKDVRERDMDFMMMEEFGASQEFADIFLSKVGKAGAKVVYIYHSKYEKHMGESDMIIITEFEGRRHALLIEDKIDAEAMPYQSSRYHERAEEDVFKGEYDSYDIFITAPMGYLLTNEEAKLYPNNVSYEEIEEYMKEKSEEKYNFKLQMINMALGRQQKGYEPFEHKRVASFWDEYIKAMNLRYPYFECTNGDKIHCSNSHWVNFRVLVPNTSAKIVHKAKQGYVDLQFAGMGDQLDVLEKALANLTIDTMHAQVAKASGSGSIRIGCPPLDFKGKYQGHEKDVERCLDVINCMYNIARNITI